MFMNLLFNICIAWTVVDAILLLDIKNGHTVIYCNWPVAVPVGVVAMAAGSCYPRDLHIVAAAVVEEGVHPCR